MERSSTCWISQTTHGDAMEIRAHYINDGIGLADEAQELLLELDGERQVARIYQHVERPCFERLDQAKCERKVVTRVRDENL